MPYSRQYHKIYRPEGTVRVILRSSLEQVKHHRDEMKGTFDDFSPRSLFEEHPLSYNSFLSRSLENRNLRHVG